MRATPTDDLDAEISAAEDAVYSLYGLQRIVKHLTVATTYGQTDVRVSIFGEPNNTPPTLLLHGIGSAQVLAAPLLPYLADRQVIAVDWPGHGLSGGCIISPDQNMRAHASTVVASVLDALGFSVVDMVGHSMGAQFTLYSALELGGRIRRLLLLGAPGAAFGGIRPLTVMKVLAVPKLGPHVLSKPMSERTFDNINDLSLGAGALEAHSAIRHALWLLNLRTTNGTSLAAYFCAMLKNGRVREGIPLTVRELSRVTQPTALAWGDADVFLRPMEASHSIIALRDAHSFRIRGAGHAPWLQSPELVGSVLSRHLND